MKIMDLPTEIAPDAQNFHVKVNELRKICTEVLNNYENLKQESNQSPLDSASFDLTIALAINSLFWLHLVSNGQDPKDHDIRREIDRIKKTMVRLNEINEKSKGKVPKMDLPAAKRFIKHSLKKTV